MRIYISSNFSSPKFPSGNLLISKSIKNRIISSLQRIKRNRSNYNCNPNQFAIAFLIISSKFYIGRFTYTRAQAGWLGRRSYKSTSTLAPGRLRCFHENRLSLILITINVFLPPVLLHLERLRCFPENRLFPIPYQFIFIFLPPEIIKIPVNAKLEE